MFTVDRKASSIKKRTLTYVLGLLLFVGGACLLGKSAYIHIKAEVAQYLIANAWQAQLAGQERVRPWPWADTYPVAKLQSADQHWYVLAGANGRNLAFAPAHLSQSTQPGETGNIVIAGHRDTHFANLRHLQVGDQLTLQSVLTEQRFKVTELRIAHQTQVDLLQNDGNHLLTLITCYPFDDSGRNPQWRYVVRAELITSL